MLAIRYILRLIEAFFKKFNALILIGVVLGFTIFIIINYFVPSLTATTTRIGFVGRFTASSLPTEITTKISRGLTKIDSSGQVVPDLAKSWETTDSGKTWTFRMDTNARWQDGKKIKTSDVNYEFSDAKMKVLDDETIKFELESKFSAFPVIVSKPLFKKGLIGLSDWKVKRISLAGGYVQKITLVDKKGNSFVYKFYPTEDRLKLAFKLGEVDQIKNLGNPSPFDTWKTTEVEKEISYNNFVAIFFNTEDERLKEKSVRTALNYAIDKSSYQDDRAISPISPFSWAYNPQVKEYKRDLSKAKDIKDLEIKLSTLPNLLNVAEKIKNNWQEAGVKVEIEVVPDIPDNYQAFLATVDIPKDPDQYSLWHSTQTGTNLSKYKNPRIDKLLEDGRVEIDQEQRKKIYIDFQRFLVEDSPAVFLYHPTFYGVVKK